MGFMMTRMMAFQRMEVLANWRGMTVKERGMDEANPNIDARERTAYADQQKMNTPDRVRTSKYKGLKWITRLFYLTIKIAFDCRCWAYMQMSFWIMDWTF